MIASLRCLGLVAVVSCLGAFNCFGQIDPTKRELIQFGYNAALEGHPPLSAYAFYYRNQPDFLRETNLTLRLAVAPTYLDSELGIRQIWGENTDLGIGLAGGGYADSYYEIRRGKYLQHESFDGFGGELNASLYHLFNPGQRIPLYGVVRGFGHFATYASTTDTAKDFRVPDDMGMFNLRTGLRWGGREPILFPSLAMELSVWYQGEYRTADDAYGFNGDRRVEPHTHLFWAEAFLAYELPWHHRFQLSLTGGTSVDADRLSAYRLGGFLPMAAEYPLSLPGYYYQELSARDFVLLGGTYIIPLDREKRWNLSATAATAEVNYLPGFEQPGHWNSGVGGGLLYTSPSWRVMVNYGYGVDALRSSGRGAHSIGFIFQLDLTPARAAYFEAEPPGRWRGFERIFSVFGS